MSMRGVNDKAIEEKSPSVYRSLLASRASSNVGARWLNSSEIEPKRENLLKAWMG